jgi:hypothetical protein
MDQKPKCKTKNLKTLRRKYREKLHDIGFDNNFLSVTSKAQRATTKIDKQKEALSKFRIFCVSKDTINSERQPAEWEKMFANYVSN